VNQFDPEIILLSPSFSATDLQSFCQDFFDQSTPSKISILRQYGLERYSQLLGQMTASEENLHCLAKFLSQPERMKFPQLQGTNLVGLDLRGTNMIRANFTHANLQNCCLQGADIIFGNFTHANLTNADLQGCTLNEACWNESIVVNCNFSGTKGVLPSQQQLLLLGGAVF
jgi:uncharacterized protein YjbI with pentapeptide repeats